MYRIRRTRFLFPLLVLAGTLAASRGLARARPPQSPPQAPYGNPNEPLYATMDKAFKALAQQDYDTAIQYLQRAAEIAPDRSDIHKQLGYAYIRTGQTGSAIREFERVCKLDPMDYAAWLQLGYLYQGAKRDKDATEAFNRVSASPDAQDAMAARAALKFLGKGALYESTDKAYTALAEKDYDTAITNLQKAAAIAPIRTDIHKQLAYAYIRTGQTEAAIQEFERVRKLDPKDYVALLQLGYLCDRTMRDEEAVDIFDRVAWSPDPEASRNAKAGLVALGVKYALEVNRPPSPAVTQTVSPAALKKLGLALLKVGKPGDAAVLLQAAVKANVADSIASLELGVAYAKLGKRELGLWYTYNASRGSNPSVATEARHELGDVDPIDLLPTLILQNPGDNSFRRELGFMLIKRHRTDEAIRVLEGAVKNDRRDLLAYLQLGYLYQETKQIDKARSAYMAVASAHDPAYSPKAEEAIRTLSEGARASVALSAPSLSPTPPTSPPAATTDRTLELQSQGYRLHQEGKVKEAIEAFKEAHILAPSNPAFALQIGYWYSEIHDVAQAREWLEMAAASPTPATAAAAHQALGNLGQVEISQLKTEGYRRSAAHDVPGAIADFQRALALAPADYNAMLQIGYWYSEVEDFKQAEEWLNKAAGSPHASEAQAAKSALARVRRLQRPYFGSLYAQPLFDSRFQDFISYGQIKTGLRLGHGMWRVEPYLSVRLWQDTRSRTGGFALPQIYSDNAGVFAVGVQVHPLTRYLNVFGEAGNGVSFLTKPPAGLGRSKADYRGGFSYWRGAGPNLSSDQPAEHGFLSSAEFREFYSDTEYYSRYGDNVIGYFQYKEGFRTPRLGPLRTQVFGIANVVKDSKGDYYNNVFEIGPGFRTAWRRHPSLQFYTEFVHGVYLTEGTRTPNYGRANFNDLRVFFVYAIYF